MVWVGERASHSLLIYIISVQFSSVAQSSDSSRPHEPQHSRPHCPSPNCQSLDKLMSIESVMPSNHLILCHPLLLLPSISIKQPSIRVVYNESALQRRRPKYWSFSFQQQSFQQTEYIMGNARLDDSQAGIQIAGRNIITSDMQIPL